MRSEQLGRTLGTDDEVSLTMGEGGRGEVMGRRGEEGMTKCVNFITLCCMDGCTLSRRLRQIMCMGFF